ncbi:STAS domain-containing protein [Thalassoroseus pseudoceratinae]|uniref:STAS domain-containing protein n=1 Tax=Thalassoroseus pseudoceratinae TaxID=2713176 RepID=UPI00142077E8|nr:STAS domain-containing protein [Thalassoroseus pseudoceratinae]
MVEAFRQGAVDVVRPAERLNQPQVEILQPVVDSIVKQGQPKLVIDLTSVPLIDSDGLEFLLDTRDSCLRRGGECKLSGASPLCSDILRVAGLDEEMELQDDVVAAAGSFAR